MRRAVQIATSGQPGPVYVELPGDIGLGVWEIPAYTRAVPACARPPIPPRWRPPLISSPRQSRPPLITGGGTILSGAGSAVGDLANGSASRFRRPRPAAGRSPRRTRSLRLTGLYRTTFPRKVYESADLLITVGSRMEEFQGGFLPYPEDAKLIQVDIDPFEPRP